MQRRRWWIGLGVAAVALSGCQQPSKVKPAVESSPAADAAEPADPVANVAADAQAHVQSLRDALQQTPTDAQPRIAWINPEARSNKSASAEEGSQAPATGQPPANEKSSMAPPAKPTVAEACARLAEHVQQTESLTPLARAATAVTLAAALPEQRWDDGALLSSLRGYERDAVERYRAVMTSLLGKVASGSALDRRTVVAELDALYDHAPIRINTVRLCRRVQGFGAYEEIDGSALVAGRDRKMIAYVELEDYRALAGAGPDGQYEVRLSQEIELYNESDGLAVWRVKPVQIVDHCRNRRRDFFVVQLIELPPRLNVGKYILKVRVTDQHGGSVDERTLTLAIVADSSMVSGK